MVSTLIQRSAQLCVVCCVFCVDTPRLFGQPSPIPSGGSASDSINERFEGYLFLDAEGRPLPFQTDEAIEDYLATASVQSMTKIPVGVSDPRKLLLDNNGLQVHAVFKNIDDQQNKVRDRTAGKNKFYLRWRDWYGYDIAAYRLDRLLGLNRVPPVIERTMQRNRGSVQIWLEGVVTDTIRRDKGHEPPNVGRYNQQKEIMHVFDNLVANRDSNLGNTLIDSNWRLWFIDCSRCFGSSTDLLYPEAITHCERGLWDALRALNKPELADRLSPFLSNTEIDALLTRRDKIVEHIQTLIDEFGEIHILFETIGPDETAPWAND